MQSLCQSTCHITRYACSDAHYRQYLISQSLGSISLHSSMWAPPQRSVKIHVQCQKKNGFQRLNVVWVLVPDRLFWVFFTNCWSTGIVTTSRPFPGLCRRWSEERKYAVASSSLDLCQGSGEKGQSGIGWQKHNSNTGSPKLGIIGLGGCFHLMVGDKSQEEKSSFAYFESFTVAPIALTNLSLSFLFPSIWIHAPLRRHYNHVPEI